MFNFVLISIPSFCGIALTVCAFLYFKKEQSKDRKSPLVDDVLRLPGTSINLELRDKAFDVLWLYFVAVLTPSIAMLALVSSWIDPEKIRFGLLALIVLVAIVGALVWAGWKLFGCLHELTALRRGLEGEQATAQLLSPLLAQGWSILHDLPLKRGNADHVLVGPTGVYLVETKYRSKRPSLKGQEGVTAEYNGEAIRFAGGTVEALPVQQAKAVAAELGKFLRGRVGEDVSVVPVVALPGWYVKTTQKLSAGSAYVINPKNTSLFLKRSAQLDDSLRTRVVAALSELAVMPEHPSTK